MGDFNAKIEDIADTEFRKFVGRFGLSFRNERSEWLIHFSVENNFFICNLRFQHHPRTITIYMALPRRHLTQ